MAIFIGSLVAIYALLLILMVFFSPLVVAFIELMKFIWKIVDKIIVPVVVYGMVILFLIGLLAQ